MSERGLETGQVVLLALFVTALTTAQLTASKLLAVPVPEALGTLPIVGAMVLMPGAAVAYALTFFASDCYSELYGRRSTQVMVNVGFAMNFVLLALVWVTILLPAADPEFAGQFRTVLASGTNVVAGSLLAYLVSQNWDVVVFHRIRAATGRDHLWLRNIASTSTSQAIDTVIFVLVAFSVAPRVLGIGDALPWSALLSLMVGQYLLKLLIAVVDTPFVYGVVAALGGGRPDERDPWALE
ncbi:queuosine precursor transporter [Halogeometricum sp. S1BR25-6]|uniref:Probable queuosine precursor transporter n=1 Tax=Halogeometricum salsisoli TaxID=2950536 RepID=A0ABU2GAU5_9EURY|nr:queuosine precursor transporter [Halogeometricum sp. S1BR25-6]MDS0297424.1 queuosine precursor transporter [Halogeometricum sp. S1BR25-6]